MNDVVDRRLANDLREVLADLRASVRTDVDLRISDRRVEPVNLIPIAAAIVAVAGFAGVVVAVTRNDNERAVTSPPTTAPPALPAAVPNPGFLPAMLPEGLDQHAVTEPPPPETGSMAAEHPSSGMSLLVGRPNADGTFADGIVTVVLEPPKDYCCGHELTVNGQPASLEMEDIEGSLVTLSVEYETVFLILTGRNIGTAPPLVDIAEALTVEGETMQVTGTLPAGYEVLYAGDGQPTPPPVMSVDHLSTTDDQRGLSVFFYENPGPDFQYRFSGDAISTIDLDGREAFLTGERLPDDEDGFVSVMWLARPDLMIQVRGYGISSEDVVAAAASVTEITDQEWNDFAESASAVPQSTVPPTTVAVPSST